MKKGVILSCLGLALVAAPLTARADAYPDFNEDAKPILRMQPGLVSYIRSHFEIKDTGKAKYPGDDDHRPSPPYIFRARAIGSHGPFNIRLLIEPGPPGHILCVVPPSGPAPSQPSPEPGYNQEPPPGYNPEPAPGYAQQPSGQEAPPSAGDQPQPQPSPYQPQEAQQPYQSPSLSQGDVKPLPPENTSTPEQNPAPAQQPAPPPSQPAPAPSEPTADTPSGPIMPSSSSSGTANPQQTLAPPPDPAPSGQ